MTRQEEKEVETNAMGHVETRGKSYIVGKRHTGDTELGRSDRIYWL